MLQQDESSYDASAVLTALASDPAVPVLTPAEQQVLLLLLGGRSNAAIAQARGRSLRTIANQITGLLRKFRAASRTELAATVARLVRGEAPPGYLLRDPVPSSTALAHLKPRQRLVMTLRARGHSIKYIGYELGVAASTASLDLKCAMKKLHIRSSLELCARFGAVLAGEGCDC